MVNMTLAIPKELKQELDDFPEINWSEVARIAFKRKLEALRILRDFTADSEFTEKDAIELGRQVNKSLRKRYARNS
jgi:hypothetical protein